MKTSIKEKISNGGTVMIAGGLVVLSVAMIFGSAPLGITGWFIFTQLGVGALVKLLCIGHDVLAGPISSVVSKPSERDGKNPNAATA